MARIRSIHPGIWTDEAFMGLSAHARLLLMGLWTEAWDDGVFEWKPLTLKARIFPVDAVDVNEILLDLVEAGVIARMEASPRRPGIIKNFQKYQRPKKPNSSGMMREEWLEFAGAKCPPAPSDDDGSEPVTHQLPTSTEKSPQMEDGGGKKEEEIESPPKVPRGEGAALFDQLLEVYPQSKHTKPETARKLHSKLALDEQRTALSQARTFEIEVRTNRQKRGRDAHEHAEFVPGLDTWLREGRWKPSAKQAAEVVAMTKLDRENDATLWKACERVMGKPAPTSGMTWSFLDTVIEQARQVAA